MIDSHCHLADEVFAGDLDAVVARAREAGLERVLVILAAGDEKEAAQAARVMACVVWLPPEGALYGKFLEVLPQTTSIFSQGTSSTSATTRCESCTDSVPRLPMPD